MSHKPCFYCGGETLSPAHYTRRSVCMACTFAKLKFDGRVRSPVTRAVQKG